MYITLNKTWLFAILFTFPFFLNAQTIIYVDKSATGSNNGNSWQNAYTELRSAIANATCGVATEFRIATGTYLPTSTNNRNISFELCNNWQLKGSYPAGGGTVNPLINPTILSGNIGAVANPNDNCYHVISIVNADATLHLENIQIKFGNANGTDDNAKGGGVFLDGNNPNTPTSPRFTRCIFRDNSAIEGGAVYNQSNIAARFDNCFFNFNQADFGGAVYNEANNDEVCSPVFSGCSFFKNMANFNGGAVNEGSNNGGGIAVLYSNCTFEGNEADSNGGALASRGASGNFSFLVDRCRFLSNVATNNGGAVFAFAPRSSFTNCEFTNNQADAGGAFYVLDAIANFSLLSLNNTFYNNKDTDGGAVIFYRQNNGIVQTGADLLNCIMWANTSIGNTGGVVNITTQHINISNSIVQGGWTGSGSSNSTTNPLFVNAPNNLELQTNSPAIDNGNNSVPVFEDFQGKPRPQGNGLDIGAHEFGSILALAVDWVQFTAKLTSQQQVQLDWQTANEKEVATYYIEHSMDGESFRSIGQVKPYNTATARYSFNDKFALNGVNFYRIAQEDWSGKVTYSPVQSVTLNHAREVVVYPNPTDGVIQINANSTEKLRIEVYNSQQQLIAQKTGYQVINLPKTGLFFIKIYQADRLIKIEKIIRL
ncbi:MAG: choice-of-anchor Q domain-containing protein [Saprospiraceae bacterium]